ncbi:MAG TPA: hypothetical protein VMN83_25525 [Albitalea sp.]|nr:hypothetical protein [Albitalea sp.]
MRTRKYKAWKEMPSHGGGDSLSQPGAAALYNPAGRKLAVNADARAAGPATRVMKKLNPSQPGARKLARIYGDALVCVRYRHDETSVLRYTTVELVVECMPLVGRTPKMVAVRIGFDEAGLQRLAQRHGATWDGQACVWHMTMETAKKLKLSDRVVQN